MSLAPEISAQLRAFHDGSQFANRGAVIVDLDGTAVHEREGRIQVAESVVEGLKAVTENGRRVVLNTLRFPINVIRTFGRAWSDISAEPLPLISLNGSVIGLLVPTESGDPLFEELACFPVTAEQIEQTVQGLETLLADGVDNVVLFHYPRDWRAGELIWTPNPERVDALISKYASAASVRSTPVSELREFLQSQGATMLSLLVDIPEDRLMAYQHFDPNQFITAPGVDKLSGAREAARLLEFDLAHSVGAGDTGMDNFLAGVGLSAHVGPRALEFRGQIDTIRIRDPLELGAMLFELASLDRAELHEHDTAAPESHDLNVDFVCAVVERTLGETVQQIAPQSGGLSSHAFNIQTASRRLIARLGSGPDRLTGFVLERECVHRANAVGIPTQQIVGLGEADGWAYTIALHLGGDCAVNHPERMSVLEQLGQMTAKIHTIPTEGFGFNFGWPGETGSALGSSSASWLQFLRDELDAAGRLEQLREHGMLTAKQVDGLLATLSDVQSWHGAPVLNHGDLRLKNVVVNDEGDILGLIDWETSVSCLGPHWDLAIALHDLGIDEKQSFLRGYGLPEEEVRQAVPVWRLFNVINYAPTVAALIAEGDEATLGQMRTRLSGGLELYAGGEG
ncbi:MAG: phosphotransferase [Phycisphaerae bacterium]|nr:phosphotransferase [Gemmatimonadaceae bacterium]